MKKRITHQQTILERLAIIEIQIEHICETIDELKTSINGLGNRVEKAKTRAWDKVWDFVKPLLTAAASALLALLYAGKI